MYELTYVETDEMTQSKSVLKKLSGLVHVSVHSMCPINVIRSHELDLIH